MKTLTKNLETIWNDNLQNASIMPSNWSHWNFWKLQKLFLRLRVPSSMGFQEKAGKYKKSDSWPWKSQGIWLICLKPGKSPWILFQATEFLRVFIPSAHRKLQFIDCFTHVGLAAHTWQPMPLSPKCQKGLWDSLSPTDTAIISKLQTRDESPSVIGQLRRFGVTGHAV